jgi:hypothetical protein
MTLFFLLVNLYETAANTWAPGAHTILHTRGAQYDYWPLLYTGTDIWAPGGT